MFKSPSKQYIPCPRKHGCPGNTAFWSNIGLMFGQRRRWWPNSGPILDQQYWISISCFQGGRPYRYYMKWNESGFRPPLCTDRLSWARRTSWGWWDDWDDTVFQTQDSTFEPWRSEAEHATSWSRRLYRYYIIGGTLLAMINCLHSNQARLLIAAAAICLICYMPKTMWMYNV